MKIQNIIDFYINIKNNDQLYCIEFSWEKNISNKYLKNLSVEPEERKEIIDLIIQRKIKLLNKFKYIFDEDTNDVEELKKRFIPYNNMKGRDYMKHVDDLISLSLGNWRTKWYDKFQYYVQGIIP